jgi:uncharacterized protein YggE
MRKPDRALAIACGVGWRLAGPVAEVVTRGTGEHEVVADQAEVRVSFAAHEPDRPRAVTALGERMALVDPVVRRDGVQVRQRSVYVGDRWDGRRRAGATAQQQLTLRVTDLAVLDDLLGALFSARPESLFGPTWSLADETVATQEAQRLAVVDARARAQAYAEALGGRLGPLLRLADDGAEPPYPMMRGSATPMAFATDAQVSRESVQQLGLVPEQVMVRAVCTAAWSLLD